MKGFVLLTAIAIAIFLACYSVSSLAISSFKRDAYELLKPLNPPRGVIDAYLGFAEKVVDLAFILLAIALIASFLALWVEVRVGRW